MNYYLVTKVWGNRCEQEREYWRFDTAEQAGDAAERLGCGGSNDHDPERILEVDGTIVGGQEGRDLEPELFARDEDGD